MDDVQAVRAGRKRRFLAQRTVGRRRFDRCGDAHARCMVEHQLGHDGVQRRSAFRRSIAHQVARLSNHSYLGALLENRGHMSKGAVNASAITGGVLLMGAYLNSL